MTESKPKLSIVVVARNDNYGGTFTSRFQTFLRHLGALSEEHRRLFELLVVEWNPLPDQLSLLDAFDWSGLSGARLITVPPEVHDRLDLSGRMPILEFWAKNVGVRRASADFVLSTNPDILLTPDFFDWIEQTDLQDGAFYRADRYDFSPDLAFEASGAGIVAQALTAVFEIHTRNTLSASEPMSQFIDPATPVSVWPQSRPYHRDAVVDGTTIVCRNRKSALWALHTNGSGDFIMTSRQGWDAVRGHWERADTCAHVDSLLLCQLQSAGLQQQILLRPTMALHMDHTREEHKSRPHLVYAQIHQEMLGILDGSLANPNSEAWGLADLDLPEEKVTGGEAKATSAVTAETEDDMNRIRELGRIQALSAATRVRAVRREAALERRIAELEQIANSEAVSEPEARATVAKAVSEAPSDDFGQTSDVEASRAREAEMQMLRSEAGRLAETASKLEQTEGQAQALEDALFVERDRAESLERHLRQLEAARDEAETRSTLLRNELIQLTKSEAVLTSATERLETEKAALIARVGVLETETQEAGAGLTALREQLGRAEAGVADLGRLLSREQQARQAHQTELERTRDEQARLSAELQSVTSARDQLQAQAETAAHRADQSAAREAELVAELDFIQSEQAWLRAELQQAQTERDSGTRHLAATRAASEAALQAERARGEALEQQAREQGLRAAEILEQRLNQLRAEVDDARHDAEAARAEAAVAKEQIATTQAQHAQAVEEAARLQADRQTANQRFKQMLSVVQDRFEVDRARSAEALDQALAQLEVEREQGRKAAAETDDRQKALDQEQGLSAELRAGSEQLAQALEAERRRQQALDGELAAAQARAQQLAREADRAAEAERRLEAEKRALEQHNQAYRAILERSRYMRIRRALVGWLRR